MEDESGHARRIFGEIEVLKLAARFRRVGPNGGGGFIIRPNKPISIALNSSY